MPNIMKNKIKFILAMVALLMASLNLFAQSLPSYVPTNGLVAWYPFNGNAIDGSGNDNNGTVDGATLTTDRFGNLNHSYSFDGVNDKIVVPNPQQLGNNPINLTYSFWLNFDTLQFGANNYYSYPIISKRHLNNGYDWCTVSIRHYDLKLEFFKDDMLYREANKCTTQSIINNWMFYTCVKKNDSLFLYANGELVDSKFDGYSLDGSPQDLIFGWQGAWNNYYKGIIDDVGIWNRALTQQEISGLYNLNCHNDLSIAPIISPIEKRTTVTLTALTSDTNSSFIWQSDFNQGFQTLNNYSNYSGTNTDKMVISDIKLSNHLQPIRAISISENCTDTSNTVYLTLADTCISKVYDTTYISVTDTLIINAKLSGLNQINAINTIKAYPNPANTHIYIDNGNLSLMQDYTVKITNIIGQVLFNQKVDKQQFYIDLSDWSGTGTYVLQIIDKDGITIETKKIILNK